MFSTGLVASRGILPQAWEEEIAEDRRDPSLLLTTFLADVRYGCRMIARAPLFAAVVVLTLTVGIGINASVFTVADGLMLRPHVYKDPASFVRVVPESRLASEPRQVTYSEYLHLRDNNRTLRQLAAFTYFPVLLGDDDPGGNVGIAVSCNFFLVDGLDHAIVGRLIDARDCNDTDPAPPAVISEKVWRQRFASASPPILIFPAASPASTIGMSPSWEWRRPLPRAG